MPEQVISALIFDCFGVLVSDGWLPYRDKTFGHDATLLQRANDASRACDKGYITYTEFLQEVADLAGTSTEDVRRHVQQNAPDEALFTMIKDIKPHYKIGFLSNAGENWMSELFSEEQIALFDAVAISSEIGFVKPQQEAYDSVASMLGVDNSECLFVDDQPRYCEGAREAGMQAIVFTGAHELRQQCKERGILGL